MIAVTRSQRLNNIANMIANSPIDQPLSRRIWNGRVSDTAGSCRCNAREMA